jgi:hypothetical protein
MARLHLPDTATNRKSPMQQSRQPLLQFRCSACCPLTSPKRDTRTVQPEPRGGLVKTGATLPIEHTLSISTRKILLGIYVSHNSLYYFTEYLFCTVPEKLYGIGSHNPVGYTRQLPSSRSPTGHTYWDATNIYRLFDNGTSAKPYLLLQGSSNIRIYSFSYLSPKCNKSPYQCSTAAQL